MYKCNIIQQITHTKPGPILDDNNATHLIYGIILSLLNQFIKLQRSLSSNLKTISSKPGRLWLF